MNPDKSNLELQFDQEILLEESFPWTTKFSHLYCHALPVSLGQEEIQAARMLGQLRAPGASQTKAMIFINYCDAGSWSGSIDEIACEREGYSVARAGFVPRTERRWSIQGKVHSTNLARAAYANLYFAHHGDAKNQEWELVSDTPDLGVPRFASLLDEHRRLSEMISLSRQLAEAREEVARLRRERDDPSFPEMGKDTVLLRKFHYGEVTSVVGRQAEVTYMVAGRITTRQIYRFDELKENLTVGDEVEACVVLRRTSHVPDDTIDRRIDGIEDYQSGSAKGQVRF